jgi:DNA-binding NtrC family response regulator
MAQAMKIAIVDDEQDMRQSISQWLALSGYDTETFASAEEALKELGADYPGIVISDIKMPGMDGMQFLKKLMGNDSGLPVIMGMCPWRLRQCGSGRLISWRNRSIPIACQSWPSAPPVRAA